ncbi:hypothetical protein ACLQ2C_36650 [Streptomyces sp. DT73]|uniref:hypothetical protein n=1 Tax=Streptomyces sp. DT73 TaxID=3393420 RepID=UPI003CF25977
MPFPFRRRPVVADVLAPDQEGYVLALHDAGDIADALQHQTDRAYRDAIGERAAAGARNTTELHVQASVMDARGSVLDDVLFLEGVLHAARDRRLRPELIERLETAVDHGHGLVVLLAECAIATATPDDGHDV